MDATHIKAVRDALRAEQWHFMKPEKRLSFLQEYLPEEDMRSHHVKEVAETLHAAGIELRYLPPYSPDMNPIEMLWSKVKALLRKCECRIAELLPKTVSCALLCVSQRDCVGWFKADDYCL